MQRLGCLSATAKNEATSILQSEKHEIVSFQDSDYENPDDHSDSEMYVVPSEENGDDSYEPPPTEQEKKKIPSAFPISRGEYAGIYGTVDNMSQWLSFQYQQHKY